MNDDEPRFAQDYNNRLVRAADRVLIDVGQILASFRDVGNFADAKLVRFAVERLVWVLGEAAARVSDAYRLQHPELPWVSMQQIEQPLLG